MTSKDCKWYRMDNSGMLYPMIRTLSNQSIYRLSFSLRHPIDKDKLLAAVERAYDRFPYYRVSIERGFFRHYLASNPRPAKVWQDDGVLLGRINFAANGYYPIWISYWSGHVYFAFFHGVCDANGAMIFVQYVLCAYLQQEGVNVDPDALYGVQPNETENAFDTYYRPVPFAKGLKQTSGGNAAQVKGKFFWRDGLACTQFAVELSCVKEAAHRLQCSVTQLVAACSLLAAVRTLAEGSRRRLPKVFVPINLRKLFESHTMFNFIGTIKCTIAPETPPTVEGYTASVREQMLRQATTEAMVPTVAFTSLLSKNKALRYVPLGVKIVLSKIARELTKATKQTMIVSNMGYVSLPAAVEAQVEGMTFVLNCNRRTPVNVGVIGVGERLYINFSRHIVQNDIEVEFWRIMRELGVDMTVASNYREAAYAL